MPKHKRRKSNELREAPTKLDIYHLKLSDSLRNEKMGLVGILLDCDEKTIEHAVFACVQNVRPGLTTADLYEYAAGELARAAKKLRALEQGKGETRH